MCCGTSRARHRGGRDHEDGAAVLASTTTRKYKLNGRFAGNESARRSTRTYADQAVYKYPTVNQVKFTTPIGNALLAFDATYNRFRSDNAFTPQPGVNVGDIPTFDQVTLVGGGALGTTCPGTSCNGYYTTPLYREQVRTSLTLVKSRHDIKMGYELMDLTRDTRAWSISEISAEYANGLPVQARTYTLPVASEAFPSDLPVWFSYRGAGTRPVRAGPVDDSPAGRDQRRRALRDEPQLDAAGLHAREPILRRTVLRQDDRALVPELRPALERGVDLLGDGRTVLKFGANRYNLPISVQAISNLNPITAPADFRQWLPQARCAEPAMRCDRNGDLIPTLDELGPAPGYVFAGAERALRRRHQARHRERDTRWTSSASWRGASWRRWGTSTGRRAVSGPPSNTAVPIESWGAPITVTEVNSGETVQVHRRPSAASANLYYNGARTRQ